MSAPSKAPPPPLPNLTALPDTVAASHAMIGDLAKALEQTLARVAALEEQLRLNSLNSSKPPSSDGPGKGKRAKPASGRKPGGQPGHKGHHREAVPAEALDHIVDCPPPSACACGGVIEAHGKPRHHQVFELPPIRPIVTEYRCQGGRCTQCGTYHPGELPAGVPRGQLGPRAYAVAHTCARQQRSVFAFHCDTIRHHLGDAYVPLRPSLVPALG